jgi:hypothetical protein
MGTGDEPSYPPLPDEPPEQKKTRRKLWDLTHHLHCPVIGTCFEVAELHRLARKARTRNDGPCLSDDASDYDVHVGFVSVARNKNALSLAAHKALEKKHAAHVRRFNKARTRQQLDMLWREALACGEVPGAFWALLTHPKAGRTLRDKAREEVHMLSHQIGAGQRADLKRLAVTQTELTGLKRDFDALYRRSRLQIEERESRILELETQLREYEARCRRLAAAQQGLQRQLEKPQADETQQTIARLKEQVVAHDRHSQALEKAQDHWRRTCEAAEQRAARLDTEVAQRRDECAALERLIEQSTTNCRDCREADCTRCPDLGGRLILCVGGRNQLIGQYRSLVKQCNGRFDHHDGGIEDNRQRLDAMLSSADAVFCPTDCVSHDAYHRLKRVCKRYRKPCVLMRSSGLSSFARALESLS